MPGNINWNGPQFQARLEAEMGNRIKNAAIVVRNHAKELIGREGAEKGAAGRDARGKFTKGKLVYGAKRSAPGEPPMTQTGRLKTSVTHEREGLVARVGTNVIYGRILELGSSHMAARPWLRRALVECTGTIRALIGHRMDLK